MAKRQADKALEDALRRKKELSALVFDGIRGGPNYQPAVAPLSPSDPNYRAEIARRLQALGEVFGSDITSPDGWRNIAISLAIEFLPTFRVRSPSLSGAKMTTPEELASRMAVWLSPDEMGVRRSNVEARRAVLAESAAEVAALNLVHPTDPPRKPPTDGSVKKALQRFTQQAHTSAASGATDRIVEIVPTDIEIATLAALDHFSAVKQVAAALSKHSADDA